MDPQKRLRLETEMHRLQQEAKASLRKVSIRISEMLVVAILFFWLALDVPLVGVFIFLFLLSPIIFIVDLGQRVTCFATFNDRFKSLVLPRIAECVRPGLRYFPKGSIGRKKLLSSGLIPHTVGMFEEQDELRGQLGTVSFAIREVTNSGLSDKASAALILSLNFPKKFSGHTLITHDHVELSYGGYLGGIFQDTALAGKELKRVALEHPHFEEDYLVISNDQQEARYLITPKFMEILLDLQAEFRTRVVLSFFENQLYVLLPSRKIDLELLSVKDLDNVIANIECIVNLAERVIQLLEIEESSRKKMG
ncbi:MAG: DUF3137 domain-containing protein [Bdellovibrionales bacterium]